MISSVCTIADKTFEPGCVALINSLYRCGFRGDVVIGAVGSGHRLPALIEGCPVDGVTLTFIELPAVSNVNFYKASLILKVFEISNVDQVFFFDADIVCREDWREYESWVSSGVAVCSDVNHLWMPPNHPHRAPWRRLLSELGLPARDIVGYANGGFVGVRRAQLEIVHTWQRLLSWFEQTKKCGWSDWQLRKGFPKYDQDLLNAALMASNDPISFVGHEGMSFGKSVGYMVHPVGGRKPWQRRFLRDLLVSGRPLPLSARQFWNHANGPINYMSRSDLLLARLEMDVTAVLSRLIGK